MDFRFAAESVSPNITAFSGEVDFRPKEARQLLIPALTQIVGSILRGPLDIGPKATSCRSSSAQARPAPAGSGSMGGTFLVQGVSGS